MESVGFIILAMLVAYASANLAISMARYETRDQGDECEFKAWHPVDECDHVYESYCHKCGIDSEYNPMQDADGTYLAEREM